MSPAGCGGRTPTLWVVHSAQGGGGLPAAPALAPFPFRRGRPSAALGCFRYGRTGRFTLSKPGAASSTSFGRFQLTPQPPYLRGAFPTLPQPGPCRALLGQCAGSPSVRPTVNVIRFSPPPSFAAATPHHAKSHCKKKLSRPPFCGLAIFCDFLRKRKETKEKETNGLTIIVGAVDNSDFSML